MAHHPLLPPSYVPSPPPAASPSPPSSACVPLLLQPMEVYVDDEAKLTLHGLQQHYVKIKENEKNKKLFELLDALEFNQVRKGGSGLCPL